MRALTAAETSGLEAAHARTYVRLEVMDADGFTWNDLTAALQSFEISTSVDQTVISGRLRLLRSLTATGSLSPLVVDTLDAGRRLRIYLTTLLHSAGVPVSGDLRQIIDAEIDSVDPGSALIEITLRDRIGALLADRDIKDVASLGGPGVAVESVMAQLMIEGGVDGLFTLDADATGVTLTQLMETQPQKLLEGMRTLADRIGWQLRPRWNEVAGEFQLAFYEPPRDKVTVDWTLGADRYIAIPRLAIDRTNIRNAIRVEYFSTLNDDRRFYPVSGDPLQDATSVARYGERFMQITEADDSPINSSTLAQALAEAALSDLALPTVDAAVEVMMLWPFDIDDRVTLEANAEQFTTDQTLAVVGYTHRYGPNEERTTLRLRGKPTGGVQKWRGVDGGGITRVTKTTQPTADIKYRPHLSSYTTARYTLAGLLGTNAPGPLEWRRRIDHENTGEGTPTAWVSVPALPTDIDVTRDPLWGQKLRLEVRDGNGRTTSIAVVVESEYTRDPKYRPQDALAEDSAGRKVNRFYAKQLQADLDDLGSVLDSATYKKTNANEKTGAGRAFSGLNSANRLVTGVDRLADISGINAQLVSRTSHGIFLETWEAEQAWTVIAGAGIQVWQSSGITGDVTFFVDGFLSVEFPRNIPYDPSKLYRMRVRVRRRTPPPGTGQFYAGVAGIAGDGITRVNVAGGDSSTSQHYIVQHQYAQDNFDEDVWTEFTGWFTGSAAAGTATASPDPLSPGALHTNVRYFRPVLIFSSPSGTDDMEIDYVAIDVFDEISHERTYRTIESPGVLAGDAGAYLFGGSSSETLVKKAQRIVPGAYHGEVVAWNYANAPIAHFEPIAGDEQRAKWGTLAEIAAEPSTANDAKPSGTLIRTRCQFLNPTASSADAELLLVAAGTTTARTATFAAPTSGIGIAGSSGSATPTDANVSGPATFSCIAQIDVEAIGISKPHYSGTFTVVLELSTNGGGYVEVASWVGAFEVAQDDAETFSATLAAALDIDGGNDSFRVRLKQASTGPSGASIALSIIDTQLLRWNQQTGNLYASLTPDGASQRVPYIVLSNG